MEQFRIGQRVAVGGDGTAVVVEAAELVRIQQWEKFPVAEQHVAASRPSYPLASSLVVVETSAWDDIPS